MGTIKEKDLGTVAQLNDNDCIRVVTASGDGKAIPFKDFPRASESQDGLLSKEEKVRIGSRTHTIGSIRSSGDKALFLFFPSVIKKPINAFCGGIIINLFISDVSSPEIVIRGATCRIELQNSGWATSPSYTINNGAAGNHGVIGFSMKKEEYSTSVVVVIKLRDSIIHYDIEAPVVEITEVDIPANYLELEKGFYVNGNKIG